MLMITIMVMVMIMIMTKEMGTQQTYEETVLMMPV